MITLGPNMQTARLTGRLGRFEAFKDDSDRPVGYCWLKCDKEWIRSPRRGGPLPRDAVASWPIGSAQVAFHLYRPEDSGRGLGTAIAWAITRLAFETYGYRRAWTEFPEARDWCAPSVRIAEKLGYRMFDGRRNSVSLELDCAAVSWRWLCATPGG